MASCTAIVGTDGMGTGARLRDSCIPMLTPVVKEIRKRTKREPRTW